MLKRLVLFSLVLLSLSAFAGDKRWQEATIVRMGSSEGPVVIAPMGGMLVGGRLHWTHYIVETADIRYDLAINKPLNVTIGKKTQLATDGQKAFLRDDDGKEKKLRIVEKVAR